MKNTVQTKLLELSNYLLSSKSSICTDRGSACCLPPSPVSSSSLHRKHRVCLMPYICCACAGYLVLLLTHLHTSLNHPSPTGQQQRGQSCLITCRHPRVMPSLHRRGWWIYLLHGATDRLFTDWKDFEVLSASDRCCRSLRDYWDAWGSPESRDSRGYFVTWGSQF